MTDITRQDIDEVLAGLWEKDYRKHQVGDDSVDPLDIYADAAMALDMMTRADIPLEELVPSEKDRKKLSDYAALAQPYDSG